MLCLCATLLVQACARERRATVYEPGRKWTFTLKNSDSTRVDTLTLDVFDETLYMSQTKIEWGQVFRSANRTTVSSEQTGVIDRSNSLLMKQEIWLHPYRSYAMRLSELVSFPQVNFPIRNGQVIESEVTPNEGWKELEGITVKGRVVVTGKVLYKRELLKDSCWKLNATGTSEAGDYSATFYFHPTKGFVYFNYDFKKYTCEIDLVAINF